MEVLCGDVELESIETTNAAGDASDVPTEASMDAAITADPLSKPHFNTHLTLIF